MERLIVAVILLASVRMADAQITVPCCLPNAACALREPSVCFAQGGVIVPHRTTCANVVCSSACCLPDGRCAFVTPQNCIAASGTFDSLGSLCAEVVCGGACCRANGSCALSNEASCTLPSTFQGLGSACGEADCAGACCLPDGTCAETNQPGCVQVQSGEFLGLAATCPTSVCTGACCLADKTCVQTGPGSCAQSGGVYQGRESICGDECPVAMPTAFTYQGQLKRAGVPLNGPIDARFSLWLNSTGQGPEHQIGGTQSVNSVEVVNGLFSVELDFGQDAFNGNARWLQIEIHDHADPPGTFATLSPRQPLTPTPYALETRGIVVTDNGNVGIGTKTPTSKLEIAAQDGLAITGPQPFLTLRDTNGGGAVTIGNSGGNVGIGTSAPNAGLHVTKEPISPGGTLALEGSTHAYMTFFPKGAAAGRKGYLGFASGNTTDITIATEFPGGRIVLATFGSTVLATGGEENLRIIRGTVNERGGIIEGSGFDVANPQLGKYIITFTPPFATPPSITAMMQFTPESQFATIANALEVASDHAIVILIDRQGSPVAEMFHFIAIGPR